MSPHPLGIRDRRCLEALASQLGGPATEQLRQRLAQGVWRGRDVDAELDRLRLGLVEEATRFLRYGGQLELAAWIAWLDRRMARRVRALLGDQAPAKRKCRRQERLDEVEIQSLQASLFSPLSDGLDPCLRAGLHRLARAVADCEREQLDNLLRDLPRAWIRTCQAARSRLAISSLAGARAPVLRRCWTEERAEVLA